MVRNYGLPRRLLLGIVCISGCLLLPAGAEDSTEVKPNAIARRMQEFVDQGQIAGAVTLVARQGKIVHLQAVGQADQRAARPMQPDTLFAIASMTKPISATAVMILQDEGKLAIDDPVAKYIPEFAKATVNGDPVKRPLTIRHLMTHTSGLSGSQQNQGTLAQTVEQLAEDSLAFQPGERWQYGPGLTVCGRIVELVAGQPFEQFLQERIFAPLQMTDTTFFPSREQRKRLARIYKPGAQAGSLEETSHWLSELSPDRTPNPSGGLFSTASDMARFYQMILNDGQLAGKRIVSASAVHQMTTVQTDELQTGFTPGNGWGLGWCVVRAPQGPTAHLSPGTFGHGGLFGTQGWVDPQREMVFVLMIQRMEFGNSDASAIRQAFHEEGVAAFAD